MRLILAPLVFVAVCVAAPDPLITPRAAIAPRQDTDPALLGWVDAVNGQYSDRRTCDYPDTLSTSASLAQCCAPNQSCTFWQSCSAATLFVNPSTSLFCDQGYCNTAVLINTVGASTGVNYLGCWATGLGETPFTIVKDIGAAATGAMSSGGSVESGSGSGGSTATTESASLTGITGTITRSSAGPASSTTTSGAGIFPKPLVTMNVFAVIAVLFGGI